MVWVAQTHEKEEEGTDTASLKTIVATVEMLQRWQFKQDNIYSLKAFTH